MVLDTTTLYSGVDTNYGVEHLGNIFGNPTEVRGYAPVRPEDTDFLRDDVNADVLNARLDAMNHASQANNHETFPLGTSSETSYLRLTPEQRNARNVDLVGENAARVWSSRQQALGATPVRDMATTI